MKYWWLIIIGIIGLVGCRPSSPPDDSAIISRSAGSLAPADRVEFNVNGATVSFAYPDDWEFYRTEFGVVVAESLGSIAEDGQLGGLLMHVWAPPLNDFSISASDTNRARAILEQITGNPSYIGGAHVSVPRAFDWEGVEAAYYLLDNIEGNVTVVLGVLLPDAEQLIAASISAPKDQAYRVRAQIPRLLDGLMVNGVLLSGETLDETLPYPLSFPTDAPPTPEHAAIIPLLPAIRSFAGGLPVALGDG
ncbi:MAG: hypothetical protein EA396_15055 [Anaerolineaceae bacterium]|nr:MAG: hypothetical protein EA396_15055 [Anaerolineaceae bacterium]